MGCLVCGSPVVDRCHVKTRGSGGSDEEWNLMPLCRAAHREQHQIGIVTFFDRYPAVQKYLSDRGWMVQTLLGKRILWNERLIHEDARSQAV